MPPTSILPDESGRPAMASAVAGDRDEFAEDEFAEDEFAENEFTKDEFAENEFTKDEFAGFVEYDEACLVILRPAILIR
jgi:hypothetical protein